MATVTIYAQHWIEDSFTVTTTGGGAPSCAFTAGVRYTSAHDVIARLNAALAALVEFTLDDATGLVSLTWHDSPATLTWGDTDLTLYLGFVGDVTDADTVGDGPVLGHWSGAAAGPWGSRRSAKVADVVSPNGRARASGGSGLWTDGAVTLWIHRRGDAGTFIDDVSDAYALADVWAEYPIGIDWDESGTFRPQTVRDGWEFRPESLDDETVAATLETVEWEVE